MSKGICIITKYNVYKARSNAILINDKYKIIQENQILRETCAINAKYFSGTYLPSKSIQINAKKAFF